VLKIKNLHQYLIGYYKVAYNGYVYDLCGLKSARIFS